MWIPGNVPITRFLPNTMRLSLSKYFFHCSPTLSLPISTIPFLPVLICYPLPFTKFTQEISSISSNQGNSWFALRVLFVT